MILSNLKRVAGFLVFTAIILWVLSLRYPDFAGRMDSLFCLPARRALSGIFGILKPSVTELLLMAAIPLLIFVFRRSAFSALTLFLTFAFVTYAITILIPSGKVAAAYPECNAEDCYAAAELLLGELSSYHDLQPQSTGDLISGSLSAAESAYYSCTGSAISLSKPKASLFPSLLSSLGILAYYSPLGGEVVLNLKAPEATLAFNSAHELAHFLGIIREDEANLFAYVALSKYSEDTAIGYSAALMAYIHLSPMLFTLDSERYFLFCERLPDFVRADIAEYNSFYNKYNDAAVAKLSATVNGALISVRDKRGAESYSDTARLLVGFLTKNASLE